MNWPSAACVLIIRDGAVLATKRRNEDKYGLPGGKVGLGEPVREAAARELLEETGLVADGLIEILDCTEAESGRRTVTFWAPDPGGPLSPADGEPPALWIGWPTLIGESGAFAAYNALVHDAYSDKVPDGWIYKFGSGTLRRAKESGLRWYDMYIEERVAFEFGYGFEAIQLSRLILGDAIAESDSKAVTETCWFARALAWRARSAGLDHVFKVVHAQTCTDTIREGMAIVCTPSPRPHWLSASKSIIAFTTDKFGNSINPC